MPEPTNRVDEEYIVRSSKPPIEYPNIPVAECMQKAIEAREPSQIALIDPKCGTTQTYGELHRVAHELASSLLTQCGVVKQDLVLFYAENSLQYVDLLQATVYLGLPFCSVPPACGPFELSEQITDSAGTVLVLGGDKSPTLEKMLSEPKYADAVKQLKVIIQLDSSEENVPQLVKLIKEYQILKGKEVHSFEQLLQLGNGQRLKVIPHFEVKDLANEPYFICYTSGTSGKPKGAIHTNRSVLAGLINTRTVLLPSGGKENEPTILWYPIGHMSGTFMLQHYLMVGDQVILFADSQLDSLLQAVQRYKAKSLPIGGNHAALLSHNDYYDKYDLSSLKVMTHGGSKIAENLLRQIRQKYRVLTVEIYGVTEFIGGIGDRDWASFFTRFEPGNLGTVAPGTELKVIDLTTGQALSANQSGEICLRGRCCFAGYLNNEEATRATIDQDGWYHSGDVGHYDQAGSLYITDRIKEMIKYRLYSITPAEIENFLHRHEAVEAVCVVGVPHTTDGSLVRAYVQTVKGRSVSEHELIDHVKDNMGFQKQLRGGVRFIPVMPRTGIGKVDRQYFKRLIKDELLTETVQ